MKMNRWQDEDKISKWEIIMMIVLCFGIVLFYKYAHPLIHDWINGTILFNEFVKG